MNTMENYKTHNVVIVEMQSENNPYGDPDNGCPQEALTDYLHFYPQGGEQRISKGEHDFIIWQGEDPQTYFANAWSFGEDEDGQTIGTPEFTTYYEMRIEP